MAIPAFQPDGWLPQGHHAATWDEIIAVFGGAPDSKRALVMGNLIRWRDSIQRKGITGKLILDGSFVSARPNPGDFDAILLYDDSVQQLLESDEEASRLVDYTSCKSAGFDLFIFSAEAAVKYPRFVHLDAFDRDKITGQMKGVLEVSL